MKFAKRVSSIGISGIRRAFEGLSGEDVINLGLGEPDFETPQHIIRAAERAMRAGHTKYTFNKGIHELRNAISEKLRRDNGIEVPDENIIVTAGASEGLHIAIHAIAESGDEVLVPDPGFVSFSALVRLADAKPVSVRPRGEYDMAMSVDDVQEKITKRTKAIIVNSPANPTGAVLSENDIKALAEIADDHNIVLISDEVYEYFVYDGYKHVSPARFSDNVVTVNAVSKAYAMTGFRLGYVAVGSEEYVENMMKIHQYIQACASSVAQYAALAALTGPQDSVSRMRDEFNRRRMFVMHALRSMGLDFSIPRGAFYVFPRVDDENAFVDHALSKKVIVTPGSAFGDAGRNHVRISFAESMDRLKIAFERLAASSPRS
ncbi:MAG: pyridoxal phosphate-dependent aminotransferase [Canidatus Methanoxibalbensis ujae]|nr:pyridoxal phosphate-dependent aminotransferase [Candidatus Methanoxibalbensis ujae]MCW7077752.1 pyridoxal phosphate-dependent aminotransferase [Candidatus Methanoxibalbensis ujae]